MWYAYRTVHEVPPPPPPTRYLQQRQQLATVTAAAEHTEAAKNALIQLNLMIRRGIEPDALMYTSLIRTMGKAGLEWQAYKLFTRMIQAGIQPLPETYVVLRDATSHSRKALRRDIEAKLEASIQEFPEEVAGKALYFEERETEECRAQFLKYLKGDIPTGHLPAVPMGSVSTKDGTSGNHTEEKRDDTNSEAAPAFPTVHIRNPRDAWNTTQLVSSLHTAQRNAVQPESMEGLRELLTSTLHEEELRIFLTAQRQLRHGTKGELVERVLRTVSEAQIRSMLARRSHYFRSVESLLAADLERISASPASQASEGASEYQHAGSAVDTTLTPEEKMGVSPDVLYTPWGMLRKPLTNSSREDTSSTASSERLLRMQLSQPEMEMVLEKAMSNDLDELPEQLLRRYAFQFSLRWKRRVRLSLLDAVKWHALHVSSQAAPVPTAAIRLQQESEGLAKTIDNFEAFRIMAMRTKNLQVVDHKEINLHLHRVQRQRRKAERLAEEGARREAHLLQQADLAANATSLHEHELPSFTDMDSTASASRVLGADTILEEDGGDEEDDQATPTALTATSDGEADKDEAAQDEIPPWALGGGEDEFNLGSGRFGSVELGRYRELADSRIKLLPVRAAQKKWEVDAGLLPATIQEAMRKHGGRYEAVEKEYQRRSQYNSYRKWDRLLQRADERRQQGKSGDDSGKIKPVPASKRLAQLLRKGADRERVSASLREKYSGKT